MGLAVYEAIAQGGTLVAEAGTGTGKTYAYLVPALLAGGKLLISTGTKPLQDQLFSKDLPAVMRALRISAATALLKGRQNYLCLHRLDRTAAEGMLSSREDVRHLAAISRFARLTFNGDRAELGEVPEQASVWPLVTSTRDNCLGAECPRFGDCFVYKARRDAQAADVVVVNHHLFMADLALRDDAIRDFLPAMDTVILDEAHQLPEVAAEFFGSSMTLAQALELARDARVLGLARAADGAPWAQLASQCERTARDLRLNLSEIGLQSGARVPLARLRQRPQLADRLAASGHAVGELLRALEVNRGRDADLDLLIGRADQLGRSLESWQSAVAKDDDDDAVEAEPEETPVVRWIGVSPHGAQFNQTPLAPGLAIARARAQQAVAWSERTARPVDRATALTLAGMLYAFMDDPPAAGERAREAVAVAEEHGFRQWRVTGGIIAAWAAARTAPSDRALADVIRCIDDYTRMGMLAQLSPFLSLAAGAHIGAGRTEVGRELLARAERHARDTGERWYDAEVHRLHGESALAEDPRKAEASFRRAIERDASDWRAWLDLALVTDGDARRAALRRARALYPRSTEIARTVSQLAG
jgi:hypothetical protein